MINKINFNIHKLYSRVTAILIKIMNNELILNALLKIYLNYNLTYHLYLVFAHHECDLQRSLSRIPIAIIFNLLHNF